MDYRLSITLTKDANSSVSHLWLQIENMKTRANQGKQFDCFDKDIGNVVQIFIDSQIQLQSEKETKQ